MTIMMVVLVAMVISTWAHGMNVTSNSHLGATIRAAS